MTTENTNKEADDLLGSDILLNNFLEAARKQRIALRNGLSHAVFCNFPRDIGNGNGRCNCGVADMLSALKAYEVATMKGPTPKTLKDYEAGK